MSEMLTALETKRLSDGVPSFTVDPEVLATELFVWTLQGVLQFQFHPDRMACRKTLKPKVTSWVNAQAQASTAVCSCVID